MGKLAFAVLYTALSTVANAQAALEGDMRKLVIHAAPQPVAEVAFGDLDGGSHALSDFEGKVVLLNFWATWCAPCRKEMPALDALQADLGGEAFEVVTVATGRNAPQAIRRFFEEIGVSNLPTYVDPKMQMSRAMAVFGLPVTVILDAEGREVARLLGEADWSAPEARAWLATLLPVVE